MSSIKVGPNTLFLLLGDIIIFFTSLWAALAIRQFAVPQATFYVEHLYPFSLLLIVWIGIFFIVGLYDEQLLTVKKSIADLLVIAQITGAGAAIALFYLIPFFNMLTPKLSLALFLMVFSLATWTWRRYFFKTLRPTATDVVIVGVQEKLTTLFSSKNFFGFRTTGNLQWTELKRIELYPKSTSVLVAFQDPKFKEHSEYIHDLMFQGYNVINSEKLQERIYGKIDLDSVTHAWFVKENDKPHRVYNISKRIIDIVCGFLLLLLLILFLPLVALFTLLEERKFDLFFSHTRVGQYGKKFIMYKLRSMSVKDGNSWHGNNHQYITKVGAVLRAFRIDELPQGINLIQGNLSLVGPRAILSSEQKEMEQLVPFYHLRLFAKPGITGWAQIKQLHAPMDNKEATERLSYDLYYLHYQSLLLDFLIILKTIKTVFLRVGLRK